MGFSKSRSLGALAWWALGPGAAMAAPDLPTAQDPRLVPMFRADRVWNGVTTTRDGRVFVGFPQADRPGVQVEELVTGRDPVPFPDATWNAGAAGGDVDHAFVLINSLRIGPDDALWLVDAGAPGIGKPAVTGGARLFRIDLATNRIARIYGLGDVVAKDSFVDDVRFHGQIAYLTDAGSPGLIVLDLGTGRARRVLDHHPSATDQRSMYADGKLLVDKDGKEVRAHADQLEVSPDGTLLYFQPASGPMWRIATRWLDDPSVSADKLGEQVEHFADVPTTGGTAIDASGTLYVADEDRRRIVTVTSTGTMATLIADARLVWTDAMWIDAEGFLWMPSAQLNLTPGMNGGRNQVEYPVVIYKMHIGVGPSPLDHP